MFRSVLLAGSVVMALLGPVAHAQPVPLVTDAAAFGARDAATAMDLSPDGKHVVYVSPGPGRVSVALVGDLALNNAGRAVEYLEFKGLDHQMRDNDARRQMLTKIGELLGRTIGK